MCRLCRWIGAKLFPDAYDDWAYGKAIWDRAWDQQFAARHDKDVLDRDPDPDALQEAVQLGQSDPEAAIPALRALADRGSAWSAMLLGHAYQQGRGIMPDSVEAERWYRLAIERGCRQAQLRLGRIYQSRGDLVAAEQIYMLGAGERWAPAMYRLALLKLGQAHTSAKLNEARGLLEQAAAQGDLAAQMHLARLMARGRFGWWRIPRGLRLLWRTGWRVEALEGRAEAPLPTKQHMET